MTLKHNSSPISKHESHHRFSSSEIQWAFKFYAFLKTDLHNLRIHVVSCFYWDRPWTELTKIKHQNKESTQRFSCASKQDTCNDIYLYNRTPAVYSVCIRGFWHYHNELWRKDTPVTMWYYRQYTCVVRNDVFLKPWTKELFSLLLSNVGICAYLTANSGPLWVPVQDQMAKNSHWATRVFLNSFAIT